MVFPLPTLVEDPESGISIELPWWRAATIAERSGDPLDSDPARAERRWNRWQQLPVFRQSGITPDAALAPLGLDAARLQRLLGETDDSLRDRLTAQGQPPWYLRFRTLWGAGLATPQLPEHADLDLLEVVRPLVCGALLEFRVRAARILRDAPTAQATLAEAIELIAGQPPLPELAMLLSPTGVLEVNVAREAGTLRGADAAERYRHHIELLRTPSVRQDFLAEYVVLARMLTARLDFWIERRLEFLADLAVDLPDLQLLLDASSPIRVVDIEFGAGDSHSGGRSVGVVSTDRGKVVYKPRGAALDVAFGGVIDWANATLTSAPLRVARAFGSDRHTWCEFIEHGTATTSEGADVFAGKLGTFAALLHTLDATDFHFENIIAAGDDPVLVDLEALLHTEGFEPPADEEDPNPAYEFLKNSVKKVGILPDRIFVRDSAGSYAVDVSAVGGHGGQQGLVAMPTMVGIGTDAVHIDARRHEVPEQANAPRGADGSVFDLLSRSAQFIAGFDHAYRAIREEREAICGPGGWLTPFADVEVRFIARPTFLYGRLLMKSMHPDFQRDELDRTMFLGKLLHGHVGRPARKRLIAAEFADLAVGDIPLFAVHAGTGQIADSRGQATVGKLSRAPIDVVRTRLRALDEDAVARQREVCEYAFQTASVDGQTDRWPGWQVPRPEVTGFPSQELLRGAVEVSRRLMSKAIASEGRVAWVGMDLVDERWWTLAPTALDLYTGTPGILLALGTVGKASGDEELIDFAGRGLDHLARQAVKMADISRREKLLKGVAGVDAGAFGAIGGPIYALAQGAALYGRWDWADAARGLLAPLVALTLESEETDIISGAAGGLLVSLAVAAHDPRALDAARVCGKRLGELAVADAGVMRWPNSLAQSGSLVGFSHGSLGIAVALAALADRTHDGEHWALVRGALDHERRHFDADTGDSADLRDLATDRQGAMRAWCHGAAGGALGRHRLLAMGSADIDRARTEDEMRRAALAVAETGLLGGPIVHGIGNHSICHGDIGNLICLSTVVGWQQMASTWQAILDSASLQTGWSCGVPGGVYTPGLMTGAAGIAWGLAYAASQGALPNLLALEAPHV